MGKAERILRKREQYQRNLELQQRTVARNYQKEQLQPLRQQIIAEIPFAIARQRQKGFPDAVLLDIDTYFGRKRMVCWLLGTGIEVTRTVYEVDRTSEYKLVLRIDGGIGHSKKEGKYAGLYDKESDYYNPKLSISALENILGALKHL
jgi:hypothetical protein